mmetsp:Transcript_3043/g.4968  ORF Transcript_3043/g.4968 Transcript_3043/m.4968 type:complete len:207 (+) Transcript_3043:73-693(+)|eukprot:CAMPEP_0119008830 /NCGR_PEP_ID=MMETSP1176-20130426/3969_1 /TAXON_ID=265551 /ORGANISM="Synedropsis recta cf, Strain CCMP1620" /LENGTH=206 /DNA_ID=CAMNT_0006961239 /DNA_START=73 /DNA_END=693 /DNA_ORIENTATION=-
MLQSGDHVCIARGLTGTVKHHAIVVAAEDSSGWAEIIEYGVFNADGTKKLIAGHALDTAKERGDVRRSKVNAKKEKWRLVENSSNGSSGQTPQQVVEAATFVLDNKTLLPAYHITFCNGECVARWCKQGDFSSGQASKLYSQIGKVTKDRALPITSAKKSDKKLSTMVVAVGAFVGKRHEQVGNTWAETKRVLDAAFASYGGVAAQ